MEHESDEFGRQLEQHRRYLYSLLLQNLPAPGRMRAKLDVSGIVQEVYAEAARNRHALLGRTDAEQRAYLTKAVLNRMRDRIRYERSAGRDVQREAGQQMALDESGDFIDQIVGKQSSPSHAVARNEAAEQLAEALLKLPENQRIAIELRNFSGLALAEVAQRMNTTRSAVAGLLARGMRNLRELLSNLRSDYDRRE